MLFVKFIIIRINGVVIFPHLSEFDTIIWLCMVFIFGINIAILPLDFDYSDGVGKNTSF